MSLTLDATPKPGKCSSHRHVAIVPPPPNGSVPHLAALQCSPAGLGSASPLTMEHRGFQNSQEMSAQLPVWYLLLGEPDLRFVCHTVTKRLIGLIPAGPLSGPALEPAIGQILGP